MKRSFITTIAAAASLLLASCGATTGTVATGALNAAETVGRAAPPVTAPTAGVIDEKLLYAAEAAYNVAANAYLTAVDTAVLREPNKSLVKACLIDAFTALTLARKAQRIGDASSFGAQVRIARDLASQAKTLTPCKQE